MCLKKGVFCLRGVLNLKKFGKFEISLESLKYFPKFANFPNLYVPQIMWKWTSTSRSVLVHFHIVESWKVGKLGKYAPQVVRCVLVTYSRRNTSKSTAKPPQIGATSISFQVVMLHIAYYASIMPQSNLALLHRMATQNYSENL